MTELNPNKTKFLDDLDRNERKGGHKLGLTCYEISRGWRVLMDQRLREFGLSNSRQVVLFALSNLQRPVSQKELADAIGVEGPTVVRILDHLQKEGWIRRHISPKDRRVKLVELTKRASNAIPWLMDLCIDLEDELLEGIEEIELDRAHRLLLNIRERIARIGDQENDSRETRFAKEERIPEPLEKIIQKKTAKRRKKKGDLQEQQQAHGHNGHAAHQPINGKMVFAVALGRGQELIQR